MTAAELTAAVEEEFRAVTLQPKVPPVISITEEAEDGGAATNTVQLAPLLLIWPLIWSSAARQDDSSTAHLPLAWLTYLPLTWPGCLPLAWPPTARLAGPSAARLAGLSVADLADLFTVHVPLTWLACLPLACPSAARLVGSSAAHRAGLSAAHLAGLSTADLTVFRSPLKGYKYAQAGVLKIPLPSASTLSCWTRAVRLETDTAFVSTGQRLERDNLGNETLEVLQIQIQFQRPVELTAAVEEAYRAVTLQPTVPPVIGEYAGDGGAATDTCKAVPKLLRTSG
ncbi:uncharacterized protein LOC122378540 [Amphibalanus amphitrite]|uniref:uncharacterized protein LOC122378540 n=1 Tax=Amphibalanus amphitrite TaxID=1232801 RepID=UPI001C90762C|nr:uncharacterized protein LOC122378540 [Amphibalanus amphitrite]